MEMLRHALSTADLAPHGFCLLWRPDLLLLHIGSDSIIALSYYAIPVALTYFVWKRQDIVFGWIFWMFAAFILACGTTHWVEIWTLWHPDYGMQGMVKLVTAAFSASTALALVVLMPRALALPSPSQYRQVRTALTSEVQQRHEVTRALQETEQRYQLLIESIADYAIFSLDSNGVIRDWNKGAERIKRYRAQEVIGRHFSIFYTASDRDRGEPLKALERALSEGRFETEALRVRKDGSQFWANAVIDPIREETGKLIGFAHITRDVSERRELEEKLRQAQKLEAIGKLTGGVAHDFNNHLTVIYAGLDRAKTMVVNNLALSQALESAMKGAESAASVTTRLLAFARRQPLAPKPTDIGALLAQTSGLLDRVLGEQIRIETVRAAGLWLAYCDAGQLENAVLNLAVNARDAMPNGGKLTLEVGNADLDDDYAAINPDVTPGSYVMLAVSDTGHGMSPEVMARAFEPFFTTKREGLGTGLGLSQVFGFTKQSGGHIKIYSEAGQGTTVKLYLPKAASDNRRTLENPIEDAPRGAGETVLIVEDDADVRTAAVSMLSGLGYVAIESHSPDDALRILRERSVDLVFTDVVMPGSITTRHLADHARELYPGVKILFTSGYTENAVIHNGQLDGNVELISKPYRREQLARRLRKLLTS